MKTTTDLSIEKFAIAVRAELSDLTRREIEELTDGLEAELAERLAEEGSSFELGSPISYASELRDAAGVAPRAEGFSFSSLSAWFVAWVNRNAFRMAVYDFAFSLRPAWWVIRATVAFIILTTLSMNQISIWILLAFALVSVQWGRKKWLTQKFFSAILIPLNLVAVILVVPTVSIVSSRIDEYYSLQGFVGSLKSNDGLRLQGVEVNEIKAFDATGTEVLGLTFEDANGNQLLPSGTTSGAIKVPDITGLSIQDLEAVLTDAGINNVDFIRLGNALDSEAQVVSTDPAPGYWIDPASTLKVTVGTISK
jgi:hypothetical protein